MPKPIEFYFDFSSPYGYLAAQQIDEVAAKHSREVEWKPFLLGVTFKATGMRPLMHIPMKADYTVHDLKRTARQMGVAFNPPETFPFMSIAACRAYYWLYDQDPAKAKQLAKALFEAAFVAGQDISTAEAVVQEAAKLGVDSDALAAALKDPAVKDRLRAEVDTGIAKGVFGSPYIFVDGEPFWGSDRLDQIDRWLEAGGW